jgi:hypothetical protein
MLYMTLFVHLLLQSDMATTAIDRCCASVTAPRPLCHAPPPLGWPTAGANRAGTQAQLAATQAHKQALRPSPRTWAAVVGSERETSRFALMSHRRRPQTAGSPPVAGGGDPDSSLSSEKKARRSPSWTVLGSDRRVLALAVAFRAANALLVRTYFNPDEHWQSLEVAHRVAFG